MQKYKTIDHIELPDTLHAGWQKTLNLLAETVQVPAALIMRVHAKEIEVFASSQSPGNVYEQGEKADLNTGLYCETVMDTRNELIVPNALIDPVWDHNPDIELGMISYCGLPITWPSGEIFGTICILDIKENSHSKLHRKLLEQFRDSIQAELTVVHDHYLLKLAHEELENVNQSLDLRIAERTANLELELDERKKVEAQLREAKEEAEYATHAKSQFLAGMSHDLRTPLNAIIGFSEMMEGRTFGALGDPHYEEYVGDILNSGRFLLDLINDILDLSKIEAGKYELAESDVDMVSLIDLSAKQVFIQSEKAKVRLITEVLPDLPLLRGDERAIVQIIHNLISNAVKFTPENGTVTISGEVNEEGAWEVRVKDTGIGIPEQKIAQVVEPFAQVDSYIAKNYEGHGLGLTLSKKFTEMHDGTLTIESEIGKGTIVTVCFPLERLISST